MFEGDAKNCFDAITCSEHIPDWLTSTTISNIRCLSCFTSVKFWWVRRTSNFAAHETTRFALNSFLGFWLLYCESIHSRFLVILATLM